MRFDEETEMQNIAFDFNANLLPPSLAIIELVRHLARISAEQDYKAFLKSIEVRYSHDLEKGPRP